MNSLAGRIDYNKDLGQLEKLLSDVARPGEYYARRTVTAPMPRLEIESVGIVSFPVHPAQASEIAAQSNLAPMGAARRRLSIQM